MKPLIAITMGCPAGIGPEIIIKSLTDALQVCTPVIFGHWPTFKQVASELGFSLNNIEPIGEISQINTDSGDGSKVQFFHTGGAAQSIDQPEIDSAWSQFFSLEKAVDAILDGPLEGIATAPVSKELINRVYAGFTGHTEYLAQRCGLKRDGVTMLFASDNLVVGLLTTHLPVKELPETITTWRYERTAKHVIEAAAVLNRIKQPRIAVAGFNPHAGEGGLLGSEEVEIIEPFCKTFDSSVARITGPVPADAVFRDAFAGKYHGVVAAYHDQALIATKLNGVGASVNITAGLDFVRTSPDHGTAVDIARKNIADYLPMLTSIKTAVQLISGYKDRA